MHQSPYDTFICQKGGGAAQTIPEIMRLREQYYYGNTLVNSPFDNVSIHMITEEWRTVPFFNQIIRVDDIIDADHSIYYIDVRQMAKVDREGRVKFKSSNEKAFTMTRCLLTVGWQEGNTGLFSGAAEWPTKIYAQWLSRALARTYPMNPATHVRLSILAALFFRSQFAGKEDMSEREGMMVATQIARAIKAPDQLVKDIVTEVGNWIRNADDFCDAIVKHSENLALENMVPAKLYGSLGGTWYGAGSNEHIAVALEYPPTFYAMLLTAMEDNSYRKTMLGEIIKDNMRDPGARQLQLSMKPLVISE